MEQLQSKIGQHATFLSRIPAIQDLQCAWLLLLCCGVARANFFLGTISPDLSLDFATRHDSQIWDCFCSLVGVDLAAVQWSSHAAASLPLAVGGLGLRSAASWADSMKMINDRHPEIARIILDAIHDESDADGIQALLSSAASVRDAGFTPPSWDDLATGTVEEEAQHGEVEPNQPRHGWQSRAAREVESRSLHAITEVLQIPQQALLRSQGRPLASAPFVCMPVDRVFRIDSQPFRILLLRCLRMPLPLTVHSCRCGRLLDSLGHHRSACAVAVVLGRRGFPLENAAARICREAGGLDLHSINKLDSRRLEVVVDGLSLFKVAQLAIDTTLVPWSVLEPGRKDATRSSLGTMGGLGLSSWRERLVAAFPVRLLSFLNALASAKPPWFDVGPQCLGAPQLAPTPCLFWTRLHPGQMAPAPQWMRCSGMTAMRGSATV